MDTVRRRTCDECRKHAIQTNITAPEFKETLADLERAATLAAAGLCNCLSG
jgi:hypothetical protein